MTSFNNGDFIKVNFDYLVSDIPSSRIPDLLKKKVPETLLRELFSVGIIYNYYNKIATITFPLIENLKFYHFKDKKILKRLLYYFDKEYNGEFYLKIHFRYLSKENVSTSDLLNL